MFLGGASPITLDTAFGDDGQIVATRFIIQTKHINNTLEDKDMMLELRRICAESELECSIFHPLFVFFDQVSGGALSNFRYISLSYYGSECVNAETIAHLWNVCCYCLRCYRITFTLFSNNSGQ